jgi:phage terminase small subunit
MSNISKKHLAFIDAYFTNGFNGKQAYLSVYKGVNDNTAEVNASKLLSNTKVAEEVNKRQRDLSEKNKITRESLVENFMYIHDKQRDQFPPAAISALKEVGKMLGLYEPNKIEHSGDMSINIGIVKPTDDDES